MSQQNYSPVNVYPSIPPTTDILTGSVNDSTAAILTIPAGRTWRGSISVSVSLSRVNGAAIAVQVPVITPAGPTPASATLVQVGAMLAAATSTAVSSSVSNAATMPNVIVTAGTSATTLAVDATANNANHYLATAVGILL